MEKLILFFIDGIGLAPQSPNNLIGRLFERETGGFGLGPVDEARFTEFSVLSPLDAQLGVQGIPQSATGQTSLFTGVNAPQFLGYHLTAFPNAPLLPLFQEHSIMKILADRGVSVTSLNLYSQEFFEERNKSVKNRFPASTLTIQASGVPFRMIEDYRQGRAVFADITNERIKKRGYDIEIIEAEEAAEHSLAVLKEKDFLFFEYFLTDHYGHKKDRVNLDRCVDVLNDYVSALVQGMDLSREALLIVSDHGNSEDVSHASHTLNPVPGLLIGGAEEKRKSFANCKKLTDVYSFMVDYFLQDSSKKSV
jgi:2,3-bisphosphoglycerate-independent phosphoglycerate mutase